MANSAMMRNCQSIVYHYIFHCSPFSIAECVSLPVYATLVEMIRGNFHPQLWREPKKHVRHISDGKHRSLSSMPDMLALCPGLQCLTGSGNSNKLLCEIGDVRIPVDQQPRLDRIPVSRYWL